MIAPKSAIEPAAITSWPSVEPLSPASLRTGISTPSEVPSAIATSSGASSSPVASSAPAVSSASPNDSAKPEPRELEHRPSQPRSRSRDRPGRAGTRARASRPPRSCRRSRPSRHARADDDAGDDLQHDGRNTQAREEAEQERRGERDRRDDQESGEGGHCALVALAAQALRGELPAVSQEPPSRAADAGGTSSDRCPGGRGRAPPAGRLSGAPDEHVGQGADHLLFLLMLLIPAPRGQRRPLVLS